jgi:hypothetical protein
LLAAILACSISAVGVWRGAITPPWFDQTVGPLRVIGYDTWNANCPPFVGCDPTLHEAYVVWLILGPSDPRRPDKSAYRFVSLPISHIR